MSDKKKKKNTWIGRKKKDIILQNLAQCEGMNHTDAARYFEKEHFPGENLETIRTLVRYHRSRFNEDSDLGDFIKNNKIDQNDIRQVWWKTSPAGKSSFSILLRKKEYTEEDLVHSFMKRLKQAKATKIKLPAVKRGKNKNLLIVDPADVHIGKLSTIKDNEYNVEEALRKIEEGCTGIMDKAQGLGVGEAALFIGNDLLHTDNPKRTTTSGTPQDTDGMWYDNYVKGVDIYSHVIKLLHKKYGKVHIVHSPSNHDYMIGSCLAHALKMAFGQNKGVSFDVDMTHRKYMVFGKNLICTSHGDGAKMDNMPLLMAHEAPKGWADTKYRYIYLHHIHHYKKVNWKSGEDYVGATVEYLRSPSASDRWHHDNGFTGCTKAIEGFVHHPEQGRIAKLTHNF